MNIRVCVASVHIKAVRFSTMERICEVLQCQPGDLFEYVSPRPGTDEAVELDAIINRPIEDSRLFKASPSAPSQNR